MYIPIGKQINYKIVKVAVIFCVAMFIIVARLVQLQIVLTKDFSTMGQKNCVRFERIMPTRGNIVDIHGRLLATNRPVAHVYWRGTGNNKLTAEQRFIMRALEAILEKSLADDEEMMESLRYGEKFYRHIPLASDITFEQLSQIEEQFPDHKNIQVLMQFKRFYPFNALASHVLGYLGYMDESVGQMGLEKVYEEDLKGQSGTLLKTINSIGRSLNSMPLKQPLAGQDLTTTIDLTLQQLAESLFPADYNGCLILMNPKDGSLISVVSRPHFDPNMFLNPIMAEEWENLQERRPFVNRAFSASYPPASLFKLVTLAAAFETGIVNPESPFYCPGYVMCGNRPFHCKKREGHGVVSAEEAISKSCNAYFFEIAKRMKIDTLALYAKKFGLGKKTTTIFPEKEGLIPTSAWKRKNFNEKWHVGETLSAVIGQSFLLTTPIQMACMIASIFEGYLVTPRILQNEAIVKEPLDISSTTLTYLQQYMHSVVTHGTGVRVNLRGFDMYVKSGTAQTSDLSKRDLGKQYLEHGWFAGYFSFKDQEPLTLIILLENCGASEVATAYARDFLIAYRRLQEEGQMGCTICPGVA
jgi:penicillin-binding protein 2